MFIPGDWRSADPLKSILVVSSNGLFLDVHKEDSDTAAVKRPFNCGIYSMLPGLVGGVKGAIGLISDSDSSARFDDNLDTSVKEDGFIGIDFSCSSGEDRDNGRPSVVGDKNGGDGTGVGGRTFMTGTKEGESKSLFPLET